MIYSEFLAGAPQTASRSHLQGDCNRINVIEGNLRTISQLETQVWYFPSSPAHSLRKVEMPLSPSKN